MRGRDGTGHHRPRVNARIPLAVSVTFLLLVGGLGLSQLSLRDGAPGAPARSLGFSSASVVTHRAVPVRPGASVEPTLRAAETLPARASSLPPQMSPSALRVLSLNATPLVGPAPLLVNVTASVQDGPAARHLNVTWEWGDGSNHTLSRPISPGKNVTLPVVSHNYTTAGLFLLNLTLNDGVDANVTENLTIQATPGLTVTIGSTPRNVTLGRPILFHGNATGGVPPYTYAWTVVQNPGCLAVAGAPENLSCVPKVAGLFSPILQVYDAVGIVREATTSFTANSKLIVVASPASTFECVAGVGSYVTYLNGSASGGTPLYTFTWDPGNRSMNVTGYDINNTTVYSVVESYPILSGVNVSLNVTDASGYSVYRNFTIETEYASCAGSASKGIGFFDLLLAGIIGIVAIIAVLAVVLLRKRPPRRRPPVAPAPPVVPAAGSGPAPRPPSAPPAE